MAEENTDPGTRGELVVLDRAVERIVDASLVRTDGVSTASRGLGRRASRVHVTKQDDAVRATVDLTVRWSQSTPIVSDAVRRDIARGMADSGLTAESVDVHISDFVVPTGTADDALLAKAGHLVPTRRPLARPAATPLALLFSVALIVAGAAAVRDALVGLGAITGTAWTDSALDWVDGLTPAPWMLPVGIATGIVGLLIVLASLKWRARRYRAIDGVAEVWIRPNRTTPDAEDTVPELRTPAPDGTTSNEVGTTSDEVGADKKETVA